MGAIGGPLLALAAMAMFASNFHVAFWIAVIPAVLCVVLIVVGVDEPRQRGRATPRPGTACGSPTCRRFAGAFWFIVAIAGVLTLARFSEAFLVLRAQNVGFDVAHAPLVMVVMSIVYAIIAYPAGAALDRGRGAPLARGRTRGADRRGPRAGARAADALSVLARRRAVGIAHGRSRRGCCAALVAGAAPDDLRGTAFGVFNLVCGIALLIASVLAGWLWDAYGPAQTFYVGRRADRAVRCRNRVDELRGQGPATRAS